MITRAAVEREYNIVGGVIRSPGKFEAEPPYVPYYWDLAMDGCADEDDGEGFTFRLDASDVAVWPELTGVEAIKLSADEQGFVGHELVRHVAITARGARTRCAEAVDVSTADGRVLQKGWPAENRKAIYKG